MRVGYVFESPFSAETIKLISMIFGIIAKKWWQFFSLRYKFFEISAYV